MSRLSSSCLASNLLNAPSPATTPHTDTAKIPPDFSDTPCPKNFILPGNRSLRPIVKNATRLHMKEAVVAALHTPPPRKGKEGRDS